MTDRINALVVVLEKDTREDDVQALAEAIAMFQGVLSVKVCVADLASHVAYERARRELTDKLWAALDTKVLE